MMDFLFHLAGFGVIIVLQLLSLYAQHKNKDAWTLGTKTLQDAMNKVK